MSTRAQQSSNPCFVLVFNDYNAGKRVDWWGWVKFLLDDFYRRPG